MAILHYSSEEVTPANNLCKQRQWKSPFCPAEGTSFIPVQTVLQAEAHTADIHDNKEEAQIAGCRFEHKSITNNFNSFLDCSWGIRQFPKLFQIGMSCWFYRNLCQQFTLGIGSCSSARCTWTGGKEVTVGSYPSPALISWPHQKPVLQWNHCSLQPHLIWILVIFHIQCDFLGSFLDPLQVSRQASSDKMVPFTLPACSPP